jgi:hypothetical protein
VAILNGIAERHLDDAGLAAIWTGAAHAGDAVSDPHLQACAECRVRFAAFSAWMQDLRVDAIAEADEAFPAERLLAQQAQILRRLEAAERPARVIAFPHGPAAAETRRPHSVRQWVAAGVAAGVIIGVGLGQLMDLRHLGAPDTLPSNRIVVNQPRPDAQPGPVVPASASISEEALLADLEAAATPRYDTLRVYDEYTPHAADYIKPR